MGKYLIRAEVTVNVEIEIESGDKEYALATFYNSFTIAANLTDVDEAEFRVIDESIDDLGVISIETVGE